MKYLTYGIFSGLLLAIVTVVGAMASGCRPADAADTETHADHEGHEANEAEGGAHEEHHDTLTLTAEQIQQNQIVIEAAGPGDLATPLMVTGEVKLNADRVAHVTPRIPGVVRAVHKSLGDKVTAGEVIAELDSRELADLKADYLAARERLTLCQATFDREKRLWEKQISAEQDYLAAKNALAEARIAVNTAEEKLHAIGQTESEVARVSGKEHAALTRYEMTAPFDSTVIDKHITLGEALNSESTAFTVADLDTVWVDLNIYQKDLGRLEKGQEVLISTNESAENGVRAPIAYIGPVMGEATRTAAVRIILENKEGQWRPGQFVTGFLSSSPIPIAILVPKNAVQTYEGKPSVFIKEGDQFEPAPVTTGRSNETHVEILEGLTAGQSYAANGAYVLKATLEKSSAAHVH